MSLERKSVHVRLSPEQHQQLAILAELMDKDIAELAASLLEKAVVGEFHSVKRSAGRLKSLGICGE